MKRFKPLLWMAVGLFCFWGIAKLCLGQTNKFMLTEIASDRPYDPLFATRPLSAEEESEVKEALDQKYTYYGCGGQAYVFFSDNGKYALKFFKQRHFNPPSHLNYIPFIEKYRKKKYYKRRKKLELDYGSYKIGFEKLKDETELLYIHLNKTDHLKKMLTVVDKLNIEHRIDLDQTDFILQRKADLVHDKIDRYMQQGDVAGAEKTISMVIDLVIKRCKKGYRDRDPNVATNCGILEERAIKIDVGRFYKDPCYAKPIFYKAELLHLMRPFRAWLAHKHPELALYLDDQILKVVANG